MQTQKIDLPRVLIIGTTPYDPNEASRALDTYFHDWPKEKLRMIFSNANVPQKWNCSSMYQITDKSLLKRLFCKKEQVGKIYNYNDLPECRFVSDEGTIRKFKKKTTLRFYARKFLWNKKMWLNKELLDWVDDYKPEAIYICFSDDYFILDMAYTFAKRFSIPIICQIGDDYYFKKNRNILMVPYLISYKKLFSKIMNLDGFGVYISQKLADKYNSFFKLQGCPFYLSSSIPQQKHELKFEFNYFGKIELGRYKSLAILADELAKINKEFKVHIYSSCKNKRIYKFLDKHNCSLEKEILYSEVKEKMNSGAFNIIASGFGKKDIETTRYSLSTKISDCLASSGPIIAIGPIGDGAIDFLKQYESAIVLQNKKNDNAALAKVLSDHLYLERLIFNAKKVHETLFNQENNIKLFRQKCLDLRRN